MLLDNIEAIAKDLSKYKNISSEQLFTLMVAEKMDAQLEEYIKTLDNYINHMTYPGTIIIGGSARTFLYKRLTEVQLQESKKLEKSLKESK